MWLQSLAFLLQRGGVVMAGLKPDVDNQLASFTALTLLVGSADLSCQ